MATQWPPYIHSFNGQAASRFLSHVSEMATIQTSGLTVPQMAFLDLRRFRELIAAVTLSRAL